jgi:hypothetical protein
MTDLRTPPAEHAEFDAICRDVEDYEPLPGVIPQPTRARAAGDARRPPEQDDALDAEILAGLVSP